MHHQSTLRSWHEYQDVCVEIRRPAHVNPPHVAGVVAMRNAAFDGSPLARERSAASASVSRQHGRVALSRALYRCGPNRTDVEIDASSALRARYNSATACAPMMPLQARNAIVRLTNLEVDGQGVLAAIRVRARRPDVRRSL